MNQTQDPIVEQAQLSTSVEEPAPARRLKLLTVSTHVIVQMLMNRGPLCYRVTANALPPDAVCVGAQFDAMRNVWVLGIVSATFDPVEEGTRPPDMEAPQFTVYHVPLEMIETSAAGQAGEKA